MHHEHTHMQITTMSCIHVHLHTCMHTPCSHTYARPQNYTPVHIQTHTPTCLHVCIRVCMYRCVVLCTCMRACACVQAYMHACLCVCAWCVRACVQHTCTRGWWVRASMRACTHTHAAPLHEHTQTCSYPMSFANKQLHTH